MYKRHAAVLPEGQQKVLGSKEDFLLGKLKKKKKDKTLRSLWVLSALAEATLA